MPPRRRDDLLPTGSAHRAELQSPDFHGEIIPEKLERLRESDAVRVIDALAVHKDADGEVEIAHLSTLTKEEAIEVGSVVGALIGIGVEGEEGMVAGAELGAEAAAEGAGLLPDEAAWDVLEDIPNDSAAALVLLDHQWAIPLRDAISRMGGFRISDASIARSISSRSSCSPARKLRNTTLWRPAGRPYYTLITSPISPRIGGTMFPPPPPKKKKKKILSLPLSR